MQLIKADNAYQRFDYLFTRPDDGSRWKRYEELDRVMFSSQLLDREYDEFRRLIKSSPLTMKQWNTGWFQMIYATDLFHVWLLSGDAAEATEGSATTYFQAVALIFGRFTPGKYVPKVKSLLPSGLAEAPSLTVEMYDYCAQPLASEERQSLLAQFIVDPSRMRGFSY